VEKSFSVISAARRWLRDRLKLVTYTLVAPSMSIVQQETTMTFQCTRVTLCSLQTDVLWNLLVTEMWLRGMEYRYGDTPSTK